MLSLVGVDHDYAAMTALDAYERYLTLAGHPVGTIEQYVSYPRRLMNDLRCGPEAISLDDVAPLRSRWSRLTIRLILPSRVSHLDGRAQVVQQRQMRPTCSSH